MQVIPLDYYLSKATKLLFFKAEESNYLVRIFSTGGVVAVDRLSDPDTGVLSNPDLVLDRARENILINIV